MARIVCQMSLITQWIIGGKVALQPQPCCLRFPSPRAVEAIKLTTTEDGIFTPFKIQVEGLDGSQFDITDGFVDGIGGQSTLTAYHTCNQALAARPGASSGMYTLLRRDGSTWETFCDMDLDGGGWTMLAKSDRGVSSSSDSTKFGKSLYVDYTTVGIR